MSGPGQFTQPTPPPPPPMQPPADQPQPWMGGSDSQIRIADQPQQWMTLPQPGPGAMDQSGTGGAPPISPAASADTTQLPEINVSAPPPGAQLPPPQPAPPMPPPGTGGPAQAPPMPPQGAFSPTPPPTNVSRGGLLEAFGVDPNRARIMRGSIGSGLTAVGNIRPGTPGAQAFAAGMGGATQGGTAAQQQLEQNERQKKNDLFGQSSTAFKDMLAAKDSDDKSAYRAAQSKYLLARAQMTMTGKGSNAWQNTPFGQWNVIEQRVAAFDSQRRKSIDASVRSGQITQEEADKRLSALDKQTDQFRQNAYKSSGIDPKQADKFKNMGMSADTPFDTKGMSTDQFHAQVPMGAWYKNSDGRVLQRTVPPPGANAQSGQDGSASNYDDYSAMQPAA